MVGGAVGFLRASFAKLAAVFARCFADLTMMLGLGKLLAGESS